MIVAVACGLTVEGAHGAGGKALIAEVTRTDYGNDGELVAGELFFEGFIFGPGIETVENNALLASGDKVFNLGDDLADDPVVALFFADLFTEDLFIFWGDFDAALSHFFEIHAAEVGFRGAAGGEVVNDDGFAAAGHADDGEEFYVVVFHGTIIP